MPDSLIAAWPLADGHSVRDALLAAYADPARGYHDTQHLGEVLARRRNERELRRDPVAHAELLAIQDAAAALGDWRLSGCTVVGGHPK